MNEPRTLAEFIAWYRSELMDSLPVRVHQRDLDAGGAPDWHPAFRRWLTASPSAEDREGDLIDPLRYHLRQVQRYEPENATFLMLLPAFDWDVAIVGNVMQDWGRAMRALRSLFRRMYTVTKDVTGVPVVTPTQPHRRERCRAQGCRNRTYYAYCSEHEKPKSDAQLDAEAVAST